MLTAEKSELDVSKVWGQLQRRPLALLRLVPACRTACTILTVAAAVFFTPWPWAPYSFPPSQMAPLGDRILVKPQEVEKQTAGGILLAPTPGGGRNMQDARVGTGGWCGQPACRICICI
jgi:hypothetical protein